MYFCKRCGRRFKERYRSCPNCGGPCRKYQYNLELKIGVVAAALVLIALLGFVFFSNILKSPEPTDPSNLPTGDSTLSSQPTDAPTDAATEPPTDAPTTPPTDAPTEPPTEPPTEAPTQKPTDPNKEYIGTIYTRDELEAMSNEAYGYGPGPNRENLNNRPEYAVDNQKRYSEYGANFIAPDNGNIYLTFDCGYEHYVTRDGKKVPVTSLILDTLKEKNVKGVFFITMYYAKSEPELVQRMINEGHTVGNHTNNHPAMPKISIDEMEEEVMSLHNYVKEHFGYEMHLFRPPTGEFSIRSLAVVHSLGYKNVHWSFAYNDWDTDNQPEVDKALENVLKKAHSGAIYLLHAISETNATLLGDAIDGFKDKGFNLELFS